MPREEPITAALPGFQRVPTVDDADCFRICDRFATSHLTRSEESSIDHRSDLGSQRKHAPSGNEHGLQMKFSKGSSHFLVSPRRSVEMRIVEKTIGGNSIYECVRMDPEGARSVIVIEEVSRISCQNFLIPA